MLRRNNYNNYLILAVGISAYAGAVVLHSKFEKPKIIISKQMTATNLNRNFLKAMAFGNKRLLASLLWTQTLLESDNEHYKGRDLNSWMYLRFRSIASLDERFYENYLFGGMFLSIVKDDLEGAADIFERGLKLYPNDFRLNYNAGFNYYFEMGEFQKGLEKLEKIENNPAAPPQLSSVINKLRFQTNQNYDATLVFLNERLKVTPDESKLKQKIEKEIYAVKAERDLNCLNQRKENCDRLDAEGERYVYRDGEWKALKPFEKYRIKRRRE